MDGEQGQARVSIWRGSAEGAYDFLRNVLLASGIVLDVQSHIVLSSTKESTILPMPKVA